MGNTRPPKSTGKAKGHDSLAQTRAVPVIDELAETREGVALSMGSALLDAAEIEIGVRGFAAADAEGVAERAGVPIDVFHAHYNDMNALLRAANARFVQQMTDALDASTASGSWYGSRVREVVEIAVRTVLEVLHDRRALIAACLLQGQADPSLMAGFRQIGTHFTERLQVAVRECTDAPPSDNRTIAFSLITATAIAHHVVLVGDDWSGRPFSRQELAEETTRMISAYLTASIPS